MKVSTKVGGLFSVEMAPSSLKLINPILSEFILKPLLLAGLFQAM